MRGQLTFSCRFIISANCIKKIFHGLSTLTALRYNGLGSVSFYILYAYLTCIFVITSFRHITIYKSLPYLYLLLIQNSDIIKNQTTAITDNIKTSINIHKSMSHGFNKEGVLTFIFQH